MRDVSNHADDPERYRHYQGVFSGHYVTVAGRYHHVDGIGGVGYFDDVEFAIIREAD